MDFVASREEEMKFGWRTRVGAVLRALGATVFDPWNKPGVRGLHEYGRETKDSTDARNRWTFEDSPAGAATRASITGHYWETLHIDLRMVDTSDFTIAYCPTSTYSVGTPHEIALCRQQRKPVLFVSPPVEVPALAQLESHLAGDSKGTALLSELKRQYPIKANERAIPSLWYMPLVGGENFFDGFGFGDRALRKRWKWGRGPLDAREEARPPVRPLLPFLERLQHKLPRKWDHRTKRYVRNDDWLLWNLRDRGDEAHDDKPGSR